MGISIVLILQCNPKTASQDQAAKLMSLSTCMMQPFPILVDFQRSVSMTRLAWWFSARLFMNWN